MPFPHVLAASHLSGVSLVSQIPLAHPASATAQLVFALHALPSSTRQVALQPSLLSVFPSSQASPPFVVPSPQYVPLAVQLLLLPPEPAHVQLQLCVPVVYTKPLTVPTAHKVVTPPVSASPLLFAS